MLRVLKGKVTVSVVTPGARVFLVSGTLRRELTMLPISVDIDTNKAWSLQAVRSGFNDYNQPINFDDGRAEKNYVVTLEPTGWQSPVQAEATGDCNPPYTTDNRGHIHFKQACTQ